MKKLMLVLFAAALLATSALGQAKPDPLEQVLALLDKTSASFKSLQTDFVWDEYEKVVNQHDIQSGVMYFRRSGKNVDVAADILQPEHKKVLFTGGPDVKVYNFRTHQIEGYPAKNRDEIESSLALGFGGSGGDLKKNFDLRYAGLRPSMAVQLTN